MIKEDKFIEAVTEALEIAVIYLPKDVKKAIYSAFVKESNRLAKFQLETILKNIETAEEKHIPICQDTGVPIFYIKLGTQVRLHFSIEMALKKGVIEASRSIPLRQNVVDVFTRKNSGNNTGYRMPYAHIELGPNEDFLEITAFPKGGGSEIWSNFKMLPVSSGILGIKEFVIKSLLECGGKPCPPYIVGIGIGGTSDIAMRLAKQATMRRIGLRNVDVNISRLEKELLSLINSLGIGTMGLGGDTTALAVNIEEASTHTAYLPVALNIQCWAARKSIVRLYVDGRVKFEN